MVYPWTKPPKKWYVNSQDSGGNDMVATVKQLDGLLQDTSILSIPKPYATSEFGQVGRGNGCGSWIRRCLKIFGSVFLGWFWEKKHFFDPRSLWFSCCYGFCKVLEHWSSEYLVGVSSVTCTWYLMNFQLLQEGSLKVKPWNLTEVCSDDWNEM